jgi:hypothetical protein
MAESKSDYFLFEINAHSEKFAKFGPISINELVRISEFSDLRGRFIKDALANLWHDGALARVLEF